MQILSSTVQERTSTVVNSILTLTLILRRVDLRNRWPTPSLPTNTIAPIY